MVVAVVVITLAVVLGNKKTESIATATVTIGSSGFELPTGKKINHTNLQITTLADELNYWYTIDGEEFQASLNTSDIIETSKTSKTSKTSITRRLVNTDEGGTEIEVPEEWEKVRLESGFEVNFVTVTVTDVFIDGTSLKGKRVNPSASVNFQLDATVDYYITPDNTVVEPDASQQFTDSLETGKWTDLVTVSEPTDVRLFTLDGVTELLGGEVYNSNITLEVTFIGVDVLLLKQGPVTTGSEVTVAADDTSLGLGKWTFAPTVFYIGTNLLTDEDYINTGATLTVEVPEEMTKFIQGDDVLTASFEVSVRR